MADTSSPNEGFHSSFENPRTAEIADLIEKIEGLQDTPYIEAIQNDDQIFSQLIREAFKLMDAVSRTKFALRDIDFLTGWNVMYDLQQKCFRPEKTPVF